MNDKLYNKVLQATLDSSKLDWESSYSGIQYRLDAAAHMFDACFRCSPNDLFIWVEKLKRRNKDSDETAGVLREMEEELRFVEWICQCMSAFLVVNGERPIIENIPTDAALFMVRQMQNICAERDIAKSE